MLEVTLSTPVGALEGAAGEPAPLLRSGSHVEGQERNVVPVGAEAQSALSKLELMCRPVNGVVPVSETLTLFDGTAGSSTCSSGGKEIA